MDIRPSIVTIRAIADGSQEHRRPNIPRTLGTSGQPPGGGLAGRRIRRPGPGHMWPGRAAGACASCRSAHAPTAGSHIRSQQQELPGRPHHRIARGGPSGSRAAEPLRGRTRARARARAGRPRGARRVLRGMAHSQGQATRDGFGNQPPGSSPASTCSVPCRCSPMARTARLGSPSRTAARIRRCCAFEEERTWGGWAM